MIEHNGELVAELQRHIRAIEDHADCAARLRSIEADLAELSSDVQDMAGTLALIPRAVTKPDAA